MAGDKKSSWREARTAERNRNLLLILIPVIIVIMVIVVMVTDRSKGTKDKEETIPVTESGQSVDATADGPDETNGGDGSETAGTADPTAGDGESQTAEPESNTETSAAQDFSLLKKNEIPQINELMKKYWRARVECDAETIYELYGWTDTSMIEKFRGTMVYYAREIQSIGDIACYTINGMDDKSWVVYAVVEIKFSKADPIVPIGMKCYVTEDEEGKFTLVDPGQYTPELDAFIKETSKLEEMRNLSSQVNKRTMEVVNSDESLFKLYGTLNAGSPLWEGGETEPETEVQVVPE